MMSADLDQHERGREAETQYEQSYKSGITHAARYKGQPSNK